MVDGFEFKSADSYLKGKLKNLRKYNGMPLRYEFFDAGVDKLCSQFLTNNHYGKIISAAPETRIEAEQVIEEAVKAPPPTQQELSAEQLFVRALGKQKSGDLDGAIEDYTEAIGLNPNYVEAYNNRGAAR